MMFPPWRVAIRIDAPKRQPIEEGQSKGLGKSMNASGQSSAPGPSSWRRENGCAWVAALIELALEKYNGPDREAFQRHAAQCPTCGEQLRRFQRAAAVMHREGGPLPDEMQ